MKIRTEREGEALIASVDGRVDGANARELEEELHAAIGENDRVLVLDFSTISYISSAGLRVVLLVAKTLQRRDGKFAVCSLSDPIKEVFEISGFDKIIPTYGSRPEALSALGD